MRDWEKPTRLRDLNRSDVSYSLLGSPAPIHDQHTTCFIPAEATLPDPISDNLDEQFCFFGDIISSFFDLQLGGSSGVPVPYLVRY